MRCRRIGTAAATLTACGTSAGTACATPGGNASACKPNTNETGRTSARCLPNGLAAARQQRDQVWALIRRRHIEGELVDEDALRKFAMARSLPRLRTVRERRRSAADQRFDNAEAAARSLPRRRGKSPPRKIFCKRSASKNKPLPKKIERWRTHGASCGSRRRWNPPPRTTCCNGLPSARN